MEENNKKNSLIKRVEVKKEKNLDENEHETIEPIYNYFQLKPLLITGLIVLVVFCVVLILGLTGYYIFSELLEKIASACGYVSGCVILLIGVLFPNHYSNQYRRSTGLYNAPLPINVRNKIYKIRSPLVVSGLLCIIIGMSCELIFNLIK